MQMVEIRRRHICPFGGGLVFEAHRLFVSHNLRLKDLLGPVTRVKKKKKKDGTP